MVDSRKGAQALGVKLLEAPPSVAELRRRPAEELHGLIEDMIKVLEAKVQPDLRRGRYPGQEDRAEDRSAGPRGRRASWRSRPDSGLTAGVETRRRRAPEQGVDGGVARPRPGPR